MFKFKFFIILSLIATVSTATAANEKKPSIIRLPFHLDLEASSQELLQSLENQTKNYPILMTEFEPKSISELEQVIQAGERNLLWLKFINQKQNPPLQFTKPGSLRGIPITSPSKYSDILTYQKFIDFKKTLPPEMYSVLVDGQKFTDSPPIAVDVYLEFGHQMDKLYQTAVRWKMLEPWLGYLEQARQNDIRGFYFLKQIPDLEDKLNKWNSLNSEDQKNFKEWLISQCFNALGSDRVCENDFNNNLKTNNLWHFYQIHLSQAQSIFNELYEPQNRRSDLRWDADKKTTYLSLRTQPTPELENFLKHNLEDEWRWGDWKMIFDFTLTALIEVIWQPGVTPHVNGLGGNKIYMDANTPITEWDVQWTIRHEFGHTLGFPDCYVEFYDAREKAMINYQIDTTDLMCSRAGKLKERHYLGLM